MQPNAFLSLKNSTQCSVQNIYIQINLFSHSVKNGKRKHTFLAFLKPFTPKYRVSFNSTAFHASKHQLNNFSRSPAVTKHFYSSPIKSLAKKFPNLKTALVIHYSLLPMDPKKNA